MMNKDALLEQMDLFSSQFKRLRDMIDTSDVDSMKKMMIESTIRRDKFDKKG